MNFTVYPHLDKFERMMLQQDADEYGVDISTICTEIIKEHVYRPAADCYNWSRCDKENFQKNLIWHKRMVDKHTKMVKYCEAGIRRFERKEAREAKKMTELEQLEEDNKERIAEAKKWYREQYGKKEVKDNE